MIMQKPRNSILQLFDPLTLNTPRREVANASPDNSDKENDHPSTSADPLSLTQFFNRTYKVDHPPKQLTPGIPKGKLIDFDDLTIHDDDDQLVSISLDNQVLLQDADASSEDDEDLENTSPAIHCNTAGPKSPVIDGPQVFTTPQNRKILADIDIDVSRPPKPPVKQGTLKISFLRSAIEAKAAPTSTLPKTDVPGVSLVGAESEHATDAYAADANLVVPMITLYPPVFDSKLPSESANTQNLTSNSRNHLSPEASSYFKDSPAVPPPRRTLSSKSFDAHRASIDLQASFQLQMQSSDFSFDLVNDKISFLGVHEESFLGGMGDDLEFDLNAEEKYMNDTAHSTALGEAVLAAEKIFKKSSNTSVPSSPVSDTSSIEILNTPNFPHIGRLDAAGPSDAIEDASAAEIAQADNEHAKNISALHIIKKAHLHQDSTSSVATTAAYRSSSTSSSSSCPPPANPKLNKGLKLPMRVPLPTSVGTQNTSSGRCASNRPVAPSPTAIICLAQGGTKTAAMIKSHIEVTDGPRRVLIQPRSSSEQPPAAKAPVPTGSKGVGPQRVLVRPSPSFAASNAAKKAASNLTTTASSTIPPSRLPTRSTSAARITGLVARRADKIGSTSKLNGFGQRV